MGKAAPDLVDAEWYSEIRTDMLEKDGVPQFGDIAEAGSHKYLLHLEGHDFWSMRIRWLARIRSLVLKQQLPCAEFYEGLFRPHEHYVPIRRDLGDLYEAIYRARARDDEARRIADAMVARASETLTSTAVLQYTHMLLTRFACLQRYPIRVGPADRPIDPHSRCLSTMLPCEQPP